MLRRFNKVKSCSARLVLGWVTKYEYPMLQWLFSTFLFQSDLKDCRTAFLVLCLFFYLSTSCSSFRHGRIYVHLYIHIIVRINKQRDKSFEFSSILWTVDLSKHLITAWIIRKFIQFINFVNFRVFLFFSGNRSSMVKPVWAGSSGKWAATIYKNVRARIYSM